MPSVVVDTPPIYAVRVPTPVSTVVGQVPPPPPKLTSAQNASIEQLARAMARFRQGPRIEQEQQIVQEMEMESEEPLPTTPDMTNFDQQWRQAAALRYVMRSGTPQYPIEPWLQRHEERKRQQQGTEMALDRAYREWKVALDAGTEKRLGS